MATGFLIGKGKRPKQSDLGQLTSLAMTTAVLLFAFAFGARGLNSGTFWADELSTLRNIGAFDPPYGITEIYDSLSIYGTQDVPLFFVIGAIWASFGGWTQFSLLLVPLWAGALMLAWLYRLTNDLHSRRAAVVAACLFGTNAFVIIYFHELRPYSLFMLLAIAHTWCYWRATHSAQFGKVSAFLFVMTAIALIYSQVFSLTAFFGLLLYHVLQFRQLRRTRFVAVGWALAAASFLPYLPHLFAGLGNVSEVARPAQIQELLAVGAKVLTNGCVWLWIPLTIAFCYGLWNRYDASIWAVIIFSTGIFAALVFVQLQFDLFAVTRMRYTFALWPTLMILFAIGLTSFPRWRTSSMIFLVIWIGCGYEFYRSSEVFKYAGFTGRTQQYPPLNEYVFHLQDEVVAGDYLIGFTYLEQINLTTAYSDQSVSGYYLQTLLGIDGYFLHAYSKRYRLARDVQDILAAYPHVLLAHDPSDVPLNYASTLEIITDVYLPCAILVDIPELYVRRYAHPLLGCDNQASTIEYENGVKVLDFSARFNADSETVESLIWWEVPDATMLDNYNISLQILTPDWENVRQVDHHLSDSLLPWNVSELSTKDLPAGAHRLMLVLYRRDTGERIQGLEKTSGGAEYMLPLLEFTTN